MQTSLPKCYLGECDACPGVKFKEELIVLLDENDMDQIVYKQWISTDRSTLETFCVPPEEFVEIFCEKLGEILVTVDFSENYSFILQDAALEFHWNDSQATPHPFVAAFVHSGELCHLSYVIISDCLHHNTIAVYLFQKCFIAFLKNFLPERLQPKRINNFSDGAASQYKN